MPDVRDQISCIIEDRALKQSVIAQRAGLTPDKLCAALKHRRKLDANEFLAVCTALGMTPIEVAGYEAAGCAEGALVITGEQMKARPGA